MKGASFFAGGSSPNRKLSVEHSDHGPTSCFRCPSTYREQEDTRRDTESGVYVQPINQPTEFLARLEEGNALRWHFDFGSRPWIASDAPSSLARVEASESADFNLVPGSQGTDDAVEYGANDNIGFFQ